MRPYDADQVGMGLLYHVAVRQVALKQIVAACRRTGPPPDLAAERLAQALDAGSIDERCELTVREGERVAVALRAIGRDGTASGLRTAIDLARPAARAALLGYVARAHDGSLCSLAHALADGVTLDG